MPKWRNLAKYGHTDPMWTEWRVDQKPNDCLFEISWTINSANGNVILKLIWNSSKRRRYVWSHHICWYGMLPTFIYFKVFFDSCIDISRKNLVFVISCHFISWLITNSKGIAVLGGGCCNWGGVEPGPLKFTKDCSTGPYLELVDLLITKKTKKVFYKFVRSYPLTNVKIQIYNNCNLYWNLINCR